MFQGTKYGPLPTRLTQNAPPFIDYITIILAASGTNEDLLTQTLLTVFLKDSQLSLTIPKEKEAGSCFHASLRHWFSEQAL